MALVQLVKRFAELGTTITDVVLNIIAFASDVPEMSKMPGFVEFDIWEHEASARANLLGTDIDVFRWP